MLQIFSGQRVVCALMVISVSLSSIAAKQQEPCIFPAKYAAQMAEYLNTKGSWPAHCSGRFIGKYFTEHGVNQTDAQMLVEKGNLVRQEGQPPADVSQFAKGAMFLYNVIAGKHQDQYAKMFTEMMIYNYFGASNQFFAMGVNAPPQFYTDDNCFDKSGSLAQALRNATIDAMLQGNRAFIQNIESAFAPQCEGRDQDYGLAVKNVGEFLDAKYQYCLQMLGQ